MKNLMIALLISFKCASQLQIQETIKPTTLGIVKPLGVFMAEINYQVKGGDTTYCLLFKNYRYSHIIDIKTICFSSRENTINKFYQIMKSACVTKRYMLDFKLGTCSAYIKRESGCASFNIDNAYINLTSRQIDKLFGKK